MLCIKSVRPFILLQTQSGAVHQVCETLHLGAELGCYSDPLLPAVHWVVLYYLEFTVVSESTSGRLPLCSKPSVFALSLYAAGHCLQREFCSAFILCFGLRISAGLGISFVFLCKTPTFQFRGILPIQCSQHTNLQEFHC